jgi:hypothetical protein
MICKSGVVLRIAPRTFVIGLASSDLPRVWASLGLADPGFRPPTILRYQYYNHQLLLFSSLDATSLDKIFPMVISARESLRVWVREIPRHPHQLTSRYDVHALPVS